MPKAKESFVSPRNISLRVAALLPPEVPRILFAMADQGHEPTEVVAVWQYLTKEEGWEVEFATETGVLPKPDEKLMRKGLFRSIMGAKNAIVEGWYEMAGSKQFLDMKRFGGAEEGRVNFADYDAVYLPGGHEKTMIPYFFSKPLHASLRDYIQLCSRRTNPIDSLTPVSSSPSPPRPQRVLGAICHGVLPVAFSRYPADYPDPAHAGKSILHNIETTTLPQWMETIGWGIGQVWGLGEYYRTFSQGVEAAYENGNDNGNGEKAAEWTEGIVRKALDNPETQFKRGPLGPGAFAHTDTNYHYVSARFPGDSRELSMGIAKQIRIARQRYVDEVAAGVYDALIQS
ncbi:hypothetical protein BDZ91DRAFT_852662 [Kalaharituber pfeilii]|nr:hypothetical protein BDZ91DRAFT_852662 [Kalaharituber pfeilii]